MVLFSRIKSVLLSALDLILPRRERAVRIESLSLSDIHVSPRVHDIESVRITTLTEYREKAVEDVIRALKYDRSGKAAELAADILNDYLSEEIAQAHFFSPRDIYIIPIPLHADRTRERGFNQMERVLKNLEEPARALVRTDVLLRTRDTKPQTRLSRRERLRNVDGAFRAETSLEGVRVFLIDDVTTTGATLREAARALSRACADVFPLALARA